MTIPKQITPKDILSAEQLAELLSVSKDTIYSMVQQHKIPCRRIGKQPRFPIWLIIDWFNDSANLLEKGQV
ncbi:excisionase family DNA binding protein [Sporomusaceae bacterium BoRhaA]|uniref:helix-turn-helix domain-containing protein n=1 Tax=Pelorhabdus rhamnosifermentans TaxID=2772457 RepID=UPI001C062868|nr:helix-turn-helix domain-containing protein [Pelorhabdus rhamnosifermentans]MBU2701761.1 excisionase family DNA binding protein [Pelorhabdus rhamnosifermentans]